MRLTQELLTDSILKHLKYIKTPEQFSKVDIDPGDGELRFPLADTIYLEKLTFDSDIGFSHPEWSKCAERVVKAVFKQRIVTVLVDGVAVGTLAMITSLDNELAADRLLADNPMYYKTLLHYVAGLALGKLEPPLKSTSQKKKAGAGKRKLTPVYKE